MKNFLNIVTNALLIGAVALAVSALVFVPVWAALFGALVLFWILLTIMVVYREGLMDVEPFIAILIGTAIWGALFQIFGIGLLAKFGITMPPLAEAFIPYHILFVVMLPLILLFWHSEDKKMKWLKRFGVVFCYIVCALPWGIYALL